MFETQGGHAESNPRPSEEGVSFYHVLRPLDLVPRDHTASPRHCADARPPQRTHIVFALQLAIAGLPISTDDLMRVAGGPSYLPLSAGNADARLDCGLP